MFADEHSDFIMHPPPFLVVHPNKYALQSASVIKSFKAFAHSLSVQYEKPVVMIHVHYLLLASVVQAIFVSACSQLALGTQCLPLEVHFC